MIEHRRVTERAALGGRARVVVLLATVLALNAADTGVIGAVVDQLRGSLHIGNTQVGLLTDGDVAAVANWRAAFWVTGLAGLLLAVALWRLLPEPARGGGSRLPGRARKERDLARRTVAEQHIKPDPRRVLHEDPERMPL